MLRDLFDLPLCDPENQTPGGTGADRTQLLALWVGSGAKSWNWAVARLLEGVETYARRNFGRAAAPRDTGRLAERLDALSRLAGFNPSTASQPSTDTWNKDPACTLRFAEVLAKIMASEVNPDQLLYLFNAEPADAAEHWFAQLDPEDADDHPLELPAHSEGHSLWELRAALLRWRSRGGDPRLDLAAGDPRVARAFRLRAARRPGEAAVARPAFLSRRARGRGVLRHAQVQRQYRTTLTSTAAWNTAPGPFHYDAGAPALWVQLPLRDEAVAAQLSPMPELVPADQAAVNDLYFAPRADLAQLAFLFPDWQDAERRLIQEPDEGRRWWYFRRHIALAHARRKHIASHLAAHVAHRSGCRHEDLDGVAALVLGRLSSDENTGTPWESADGKPPTALMWNGPAGGAVAALLGLTGTGLVGEYGLAQAPSANPIVPAPGGSSGQLVWRDVRGPLEAFGHERDASNSPVAHRASPPLAMSLAGPPGDCAERLRHAA